MFIDIFMEIIEHFYFCHRDGCPVPADYEKWCQNGMGEYSYSNIIRTIILQYFYIGKNCFLTTIPIHIPTWTEDIFVGPTTHFVHNLKSALRKTKMCTFLSKVL